MIEIACRYEKPVRIGVNWGSLDQALVARLMDDNARRSEAKDAQDIMHEIMVTSALESAAQAVGEKLVWRFARYSQAVEEHLSC